MKKTISILLFALTTFNLSFAASKHELSKEQNSPVAHSAGKKLVKGTCCWVEHYLQNPIVFLTLIY